jgi:hypothetical protein
MLTIYDIVSMYNSIRNKNTELMNGTTIIQTMGLISLAKTLKYILELISDIKHNDAITNDHPYLKKMHIDLTEMFTPNLDYFKYSNNPEYQNTYVLFSDEKNFCKLFIDYYQFKISDRKWHSHSNIKPSFYANNFTKVYDSTIYNMVKEINDRINILVTNKLIFDEMIHCHFKNLFLPFTSHFVEKYKSFNQLNKMNQSEKPEILEKPERLERIPAHCTRKRPHSESKFSSQSSQLSQSSQSSHPSKKPALEISSEFVMSKCSIVDAYIFNKSTGKYDKIYVYVDKTRLA